MGNENSLWHILKQWELMDEIGNMKVKSIVQKVGAVKIVDEDDK